MPKLRVHNLTISLDGYAAGPNQGLDNPMGIGGMKIHEWAIATRSWRALHGMKGGEKGLDNQFIELGELNIGATIMGRNMFGPIRGPWTDEDWKGWWGDDPPFRHPVFVLTNFDRESIKMKGGTTFHFVTDGFASALEQAFDAANGEDIRVGGGPITIQQYLNAGLIDEMHVAIAPILLGGGTRLFDNLSDGPIGLECVEFVSSPTVVHARFARSGASSTDAK